MMRTLLLCPLLFFPLLSSVASAADVGMVSNYAFGAFPADPGAVWIVSRGDAGSGATRLALAISDGRPVVRSYGKAFFPDGVEAVHDHVFTDLTGERMRLNGFSFGSFLWLPAYGSSSDGDVLPLGFLRISGGETLYDSVPFAAADPSLYGLTGAVRYQDSAYATFGAAGIASSPWGTNGPEGPWNFRVFSKSGIDSAVGTCATSLECPVGSWSDSLGADSVQRLQLLGLAPDGESGIWMATSHGLLRGTPWSLHPVSVPGLDTARITGIWAEPSGRRIIAETGVRSKDRTVSQLWRSLDGGNSFSPVPFQDSLGHARTGFYDSLDVAVTGAAWAGGKVFLPISRIEGSVSGILVLDSVLRITHNIADDDDPASQAVFGLEDSLAEQPVPVTGACAIAVGVDTVVVLTTYGAGVVLSSDTGKTWVTVRNRTAVKGGLSEVRPTPSVMRYPGLPVQIGYRLDKDAKVTIEVFSYAMEPVRTIVRSAQRSADPVRSNDPRVDTWDGTDDHGNLVGAGLYYVRVRSGNKEAWGKILNLVGRSP